MWLWNKKPRKNLDGLNAWSESRPTESEVKSIKHISKYARDSNCVLYFAHVGSHHALEQITEERKMEQKFS
uniref:Dihydropyrimidinase (DPYS) n=1 Tax=uncultured marine thaumarchaeote AD1000_80_D11 TaxID=1455942 RepID=A0A075FZB3_9ARCH|nr:Dihydropyrimidinase (DPYS) [uncultured marine thaumarchaeote AD1000_80_D11]